MYRLPSYSTILAINEFDWIFTIYRRQQELIPMIHSRKHLDVSSWCFSLLVIKESPINLLELCFVWVTLNFLFGRYDPVMKRMKSIALPLITFVLSITLTMMYGDWLLFCLIASRRPGALPPMESKPKADEILNAIIPPREWIQGGK